jgi:hypothetical protein
MPFVTVLSSRSARRDERVKTAGRVICRRGANRQETQLLDLSRGGLRLKTTSGLRTGERVWLKLDTLEPLEARVVWNDGISTGCEFLVPLHPAIFQVLSKMMSK